MRRRIVLLLFFICLILQPVTGSAMGETVRIGFVPTPGFAYHKFNGQMGGYAVTWMAEIAKYTNWKYNYVPFDSNKQMIEAVENGTIDTCIGFGPRPSTSDKLLFTTMKEEPFLLYTQPTSDQFFYEDYTHFNSRRIALIPNTMEDLTLRRYALQNRFEYTVIPCTSYRDVFHALDTGDADIALGSMFYGTPDYRVVGYLGNDISWTAVSLTRKDNFPAELSAYQLVAKLSSAPENFPPRPDLSMRFYHGTTFTRPSLTREELHWLEYHPVVEIAYTERPPFMYTDPKTGEAKGIAIDIFRQIAQHLSLSFTFVKHEEDGISASEYLNAPGNPHALLGMRYIPGRRDLNGISLSCPYSASAFGFVGKRGRIYSMTDWLTVAVPSASRGTQQFLEASYSAFVPVLFKTQDACLEAVRDGKADLAIMDIYTINYLLRRPRYDDLTGIQAGRITPQEYCLGVADAVAPEFLSIINKTLLTIPPDVRQEIVLRHTKDPHWTPDFTDYLYKYSVAVVIIVLLLILLVYMIISEMYTRSRNMQILEAKNAELTDAIASVEYANQSKSRFLARMSHELRTPMNAILGFTNIALDHPEKQSTVREYLRKIRLSSQALLSIINDILDMSAIESNKLVIKNAPFKISDSVTAVHEMYLPQCELKKVHYEVISDTADEDFRGDQNRINQILLNLVSNAVKFTSEGGSIRVEFHEYNIKDDTAWLKFIVKDTGIGMSEEFRSRIFKPFEQASAETFQKYGGSGLGLSITKNLTELMKGYIEVDSTEGVGTTFTIHLPVGRIPKKQEAAPDTTSHYDFSGAKILIAEDNALNLEIATMLLEDTGIEVTPATDGQQVIDKFTESEGGTFDLILMDIQMPLHSGYEATEIIRASEHPQAKTIPIIAMTANAFEEDIRHAHESGMNEHLAKPIDVGKLYKALAEYLPKKNNN